LTPCSDIATVSVCTMHVSMYDGVTTLI